MRISPDGPTSGPGASPMQHPIDSLAQHPPMPEGVSFEDLDIIRNRTALLGEVTVMSVDYFNDTDGRLTNRLDTFARVEVGGYGYGLRITDPDPKVATNLQRVHMPGFGEIIERGSAFNFHTAQATISPESRTISISSDGVGTTSESLTLDNFWEHDMERMGEGRSELLEVIVGDEPTITSECSMGSVITHKMLIYDSAKGRHNLNIFPIHYDTAVVTPKLAPFVMGVLFGPSMLIDIPREAIRMMVKYGPEHVLALAPMLYERGGDRLALLRQASSLMGGVAIDETTKVAETYGGITISGQLDPLRQPRMWSRVKQDLDSRDNNRGPGLHIVRVTGKGHGIGADGVGGARKVTKASEFYEVERLLVA